MPPVDPYKTYAAGPTSFGARGVQISPGATDLDPVPKAIVCLTGGDLTIVPMNNGDGVTLTFTGVTAGFIPPYRVRRVTAATAAVASVLD